MLGEHDQQLQLRQALPPGRQVVQPLQPHHQLAGGLHRMVADADPGRAVHRPGPVHGQEKGPLDAVVEQERRIVRHPGLQRLHDVGPAAVVYALPHHAKAGGAEHGLGHYCGSPVATADSPSSVPVMSTLIDSSADARRAASAQACAALPVPVLDIEARPGARTPGGGAVYAEPGQPAPV